MSLRLDNPVQPRLEMPPDPAVWQRCQTMSEAIARWQVYLHHLGANALVPWFQDAFEGASQPWPTAAPYDLWHVVDGVALTLGKKRIVVMLSEALDATELRVPQEWVDIPSWVSDYYIAAHVDVDEQQLSLWGYTTHAQLKARGIYDPDGQTYCLHDSNLVEDFSVFQVACQLGEVCRGPVVDLVALPAQTAEQTAEQASNRLKRLAHSPDPRLEIPFAQWGALMSDRPWRQAFYERRQGLGSSPVTSPVSSNSGTSKISQKGSAPQSSINIGHWLNRVFDQGWQTVDSLLPQTPVFSFRTVIAGDAMTVRGKAIVLRATPATLELAVVLIVKLEGDGRRNIRILLYPADGLVLFPEVEMTLEMSDTGDVLQKVRAGEQDNYIQLPPFRCAVEQLFSVKIALADGSVQLDFVS